MLRIAALALVLCVGTVVFGEVQYTTTSLGSFDAYGINNSGQVVGMNSAAHAGIWSNGTMTDLV